MRTCEIFPGRCFGSAPNITCLGSISQNRKYFGISRPENGKIAYNAAAEELIEGELKQHGLDEFTISAGEYLYIVVTDFMQNIQAI